MRFKKTILRIIYKFLEYIIYKMNDIDNAKQQNNNVKINDNIPMIKQSMLISTKEKKT